MFRAIFTVGIAMLIIVTTAPLWLRGIGEWTIAEPSAIPAEVDVIVVLGGDNGRLEEGIRLFQRGVAPEFWHTGQDDGVSTAVATAGIPASALRILPSNTTWEDAGSVAEAIRESGAKRVLIITSWYHGRRAQRCLEKRAAGLGVTFYYHAVAPLGHDQRDWWKAFHGRNVVILEIKKAFYYFFVYGVSLD